MKYHKNMNTQHLKIITILNITFSNRSGCESTLNATGCQLFLRNVSVDNNENAYYTNWHTITLRESETHKHPIEVRYIENVASIKLNWEGKQLEITKDNVDQTPEALKPFINEDAFKMNQGFNSLFF